MSPIHCDPFDSVRIFKDAKVKQAIGMHWGPLSSPPQFSFSFELMTSFLKVSGD